MRTGWSAGERHSAAATSWWRPCSPPETDTIHADNLRAHRLGINGVPCFVVSGCHAIAGAQEPEVIERLLDVAAAEAING
jgi:predicted DsbA family dithiol-disulfide isomerase